MEREIMQIDMHFYATYACARLAGFEKKEANIIATAAEFVDDAHYDNSGKNANNEMMFAICTAHHLKNIPRVSFENMEEHRLVWVPFHFYPGGKGKTLDEKLLCIKDSDIVQQMFSNHLNMKDKSFYLQLLGIASHVYLDTFSHYGFSGICSNLNHIKGSSLESEIEDDKIKGYVEAKDKRFLKKFIEEMLSVGAEIASQGLGHGAVATYPDRPYMKWRFEYSQGRYGNGKDSGRRNNTDTFLEGLQKLHKLLQSAAKSKYATPKTHEFPEDKIKEILGLEAEKKDRSEAWIQFIKQTFNEETPTYYGADWNNEKDNFDDTKPGTVGDCYRFHQAAAYHRWYTLKDLLPEHEIYVV